MNPINYKFSKKSYLRSKDFAVSGEDFALKIDKSIDLLKTCPQPSVDNISKYYDSDDYISHTDGHRNWFEKIYQFIKKINLQKKLKLINYWNIEEGKILDFGAGTGEFMLFAKNHGWKTFCLETNVKATELGKNKGLCYANSIEDFEDHFFDVITLWHVLEHVPNFDETIEILKHKLKPDGTLIVAVPNFKSYDAQFYGKFWAAYDLPRHYWHFSRKSIDSIFEYHHMKILKTYPMIFDSFYVSLLSEQYKNKKKSLLKGFVNGCISNFKAVKTKEYSSIIYIIKNH
uniref:class I SAM-dependent methyltransferase n=1 Tax=Flavobacterium sp. TaxID=239 RepID=UPI00404B0252